MSNWHYATDAMEKLTPLLDEKGAFASMSKTDKRLLLDAIGDIIDVEVDSLQDCWDMTGPMC